MFEEFLGGGEVIEEREAEPDRLKELVLVIDWKRPLHVVVIGGVPVEVCSAA